jgi:hypothetical protein
MFGLLLLLVSGCSTSLSVRGIQSPNYTVKLRDPIFVDSQTNMPIEHRRFFVDAGVIAHQAGVNAVVQNEAKHILFLNFEPGFTYDPDRKYFRVSYGRTVAETFNGLIDAGLFRLGENNKTYMKPSVWEGWVEVRDIRSMDELTEALGLLYSKLGQEANGRVKSPPKAGSGSGAK